MITTITIADKTYELKLKTKGIIRLEKELCHGGNLLSLFSADGAALPGIATMIAVFREASGAANAEELFDTWIEEGHNQVEFLQIMIELFTNSGLMPKSAGGSKTAENP